MVAAIVISNNTTLVIYAQDSSNIPDSTPIPVWVSCEPALEQEDMQAQEPIVEWQSLSDEVIVVESVEEIVEVTETMPVGEEQVSEDNSTIPELENTTVELTETSDESEVGSSVTSEQDPVEVSTWVEMHINETQTIGDEDIIQEASVKSDATTPQETQIEEIVVIQASVEAEIEKQVIEEMPTITLSNYQQSSTLVAASAVKAPNSTISDFIKSILG